MKVKMLKDHKVKYGPNKGKVVQEGTTWDAEPNIDSRYPKVIAWMQVGTYNGEVGSGKDVRVGLSEEECEVVDD